MGRKSREKRERKKEKLIVFVCTANVCRSPMAEKLFVDALEKSSSKKNIKVFSAGISAMDGDQASENSIQACEEIGLDLKDHRSAALTRATAENASAIFCMTESHRALLQMYFDLQKKRKFSSCVNLLTKAARNFLIHLGKASKYTGIAGKT